MKELPPAVTESDMWKSRALKAEEELSALRRWVEGYMPNLPKPSPVTLDPDAAAFLVLDLSNRCHDPGEACSRIVADVKTFLCRARAVNLFTLYTVSLKERDTPRGGVWDGFGALHCEPVITPDAFDKFHGGELCALLRARGIRTVVIAGASTNNAVLFTAASAARIHKYNVVIPLDGVIAKSDYENGYALHQLTVMPGGANKLCSFTLLKDISFLETPAERP